MTYTPQTWHDLPVNDTPISAARLGHIETGIADLAKCPPALLDAAIVETLNTTATVTVVPNSGVTTIASGIEAANMVGTPDRIGKIGTTMTNMVAVQNNFFGPGWKEDYAAGGFGAVVSSSWAAEIWCSGTRYVEFIIGRTDISTSNIAAYRVWVDGRKKTDLPVNSGFGNVGQAATIKVDFGAGNTVPHKVRLDMFGVALAGIWTEPAGIVWPSVPSGPRLFVLGPSLEQGTIPERHTGGEIGAWLHRFANLVGIQDFWNGGEGGTGPFTVSPQGHYQNYQTRVNSTVVPANPDIVLVSTWVNDQGSGRNAAQIAGDLSNVLALIKTGLPQAKVIVMGGIDSQAPTNTASMVTIDNAVKPVCVSAGAAFTSGVTGEVVGFDGTLLATLPPWITSGNKGTVISPDQLHPTDVGHQYIAYVMRTVWKLVWGL